MNIEADIQAALADLIGKRCCRQRVGRGRSLSIGFGAEVPHSKSNTVDSFYGEWEIGTYAAAWRIVRNGVIVCGSLEVVDSIDEIDQQLQAIDLGAVLEVKAVSDLDIQLRLEDGTCIDFMCASTDRDEMFHIFGPGDLYVEYAPLCGWSIGKSNAPWG